jgi:polar amino acid transport system ATP-binding protein
MNSESPIIRVEEISKSFAGKVQALDQFSLSVNAGEVVVLIGPSGSGKSTLLRSLNGLEEIDEGRIWINGTELTRSRRALRQIRHEVGMVFQSFNLFPHLNVLQNINLAQMRTRGLSVADASAVSLALLERVGLADRADAYPPQLSGGQQQRVAIARALALKPLIMLFDEVTSALDPEMIGEVLDVMQGLARDGMTMLVVTHEMGFAREAGDRIVFMADGALIEDADAQTFFTAPQHPRTQSFLRQIR